jgi:hypothetical protein
VRVQNLSTGIDCLRMSTEVYPELKILPHIPFLSIIVVCCLSVFLSIFLSEKSKIDQALTGLESRPTIISRQPRDQDFRNACPPKSWSPLRHWEYILTNLTDDYIHWLQEKLLQASHSRGFVTLTREWMGCS